MADILDIVFDNKWHLGRQLQDHLFTQWRRFREEIQISENFEFRKYYLITGAVGLTLTGVLLTNYKRIQIIKMGLKITFQMEI